MEITTNANLHEELVHEILLRLPVKALSRFKCVCKQWCGLIGSLGFVKEHFGHESNQQRLLTRLGKPDEKGFKYALFVDETFSEYEEPCHLQMPDAASELIGPLNGVFCLANECPWQPMALLNPALRQFKPLPRVPSFGPPDMGNFRKELGLGLDPLTEDHKLVLILYFMDSKMDIHCVVYVCTSDSDSWRLLEDVDPIVSSRPADTSVSNTYLNGVYYWLLEYHETAAFVVLAFDMRTEKFREIKVTACDDESKVGILALCGDSLTLLLYNRMQTSFIDVWIMTNEGYWIKTSKVGPLDDMNWLHCFWKNNELLLETMADFLTLCNVSTLELRGIEAQKADNDPSSPWFFIYKESLVSIKGEAGAGKCKLWDTSSDFIKEFFEYSSSE